VLDRSRIRSTGRGTGELLVDPVGMHLDFIGPAFQHGRRVAAACGDPLWNGEDERQGNASTANAPEMLWIKIEGSAQIPSRIPATLDQNQNITYHIVLKVKILSNSGKELEPPPTLGVACNVQRAESRANRSFNSRRNQILCI
jgi:hypothetical protein